MVEEGPKGKTIITIAVDFEPEPEDQPTKNCYSCGSKTVRTSFNFKLVDEEDGLIIQNADLVPGTKCTGCEAEYLDPLATLQLLAEAIKILPPESKFRKTLQSQLGS